MPSRFHERVIDRDLRREMRAAARHYPIVTVTGPRQAGKTTLCRATFPKKAYVSLEPLDVRSFAEADPRGFLDEYHRGAVIDEVQRVPSLLSYLQEDVDRDPKPGRFVLTGSQQLDLVAAVTQSLAGRTAILHLLPLAWNELARFPSPPTDLWSAVFSGGYPRIFDREIPPSRWLADYVTTYVQRDVRQLLNVTDLATFATFLKLCAGRTAQEVNASALGSDAGVTHNTARAWLSVLEASYVVFRIPPWHRNVTKQAVKAPKMHFFDTGLVCHLLGIRSAKELLHHPLRGAIFESWVASEIYKARVHQGLPPALFHLRDAKLGEVDLVVDGGRQTILVEAKSGATLAGDAFAPLSAMAERAKKHRASSSIGRRIVYGGAAASRRSGIDVVPWSDVDRASWK